MQSPNCDLKRARKRRRLIKLYFEELCDRNTGKLNKQGLKEILKKMGDPMLEPECDAIFKEADKDGDGLVSLDELMKTTILTELHDSFCQDVEDLFNSVDKDGDGLITLQETKQAFARVYKDTFDVAHIEHIFEEVDRDKDGKINYEEFVQIFASN